MNCNTGIIIIVLCLVAVRSQNPLAQGFLNRVEPVLTNQGAHLLTQRLIPTRSEIHLSFPEAPPWCQASVG